MAELFGTAAGILQVAEVGFNLATTLYKYASTVKGAERDIKRIARDVKLTSKVLERTHQQLKADQQAQLCTDDAIVDLEDVLEGCREAFKEVDDSLNKSMRPSNGKIGMSLAEKLKWPLKQDKLEVLRANLEKLKTTLLLMLSVFAYGSKIKQTQFAKSEITAGLSLEKLQIQNLIQAKDEATSRYEQLSAAFTKLETRINDSARTVLPPVAPAIAANTISMMALPGKDPRGEAQGNRGFRVQTADSSLVSEQLQICASAVSKLSSTIDIATERWRNHRILEHERMSRHLQETADAILGLQNSATSPELPSALAGLLNRRPSVSAPVSSEDLYQSPQCVLDPSSQEPPSAGTAEIDGHRRRELVAMARSRSRYDSAALLRRPSLNDRAKESGNSRSELPTRNRPSDIQQDLHRPASPQHAYSDYPSVLATLQQSDGITTTHKKLYSVDDDSVKLRADVDISSQQCRQRPRRRRDSLGRESIRVDQDRSRRESDLPSTYARIENDAYQEGVYDYTDPSLMYRDTELRSRDVRPRRGSLQRNGATNPERIVLTSTPTSGIRPRIREMGPPPSTRGWDRISNDGIPQGHESCHADLADLSDPAEIIVYDREVLPEQSGLNGQLTCPYRNCKWHFGRGFTRKEILNEHLRDVHESILPSTEASSKPSPPISAMHSPPLAPVATTSRDGGRSFPPSIVTPLRRPPPPPAPGPPGQFATAGSDDLLTARAAGENRRQRSHGSSMAFQAPRIEDDCQLWIKVVDDDVEDHDEEEDEDFTEVDSLLRRWTKLPTAV